MKTNGLNQVTALSVPNPVPALPPLYLLSRPPLSFPISTRHPYHPHLLAGAIFLWLSLLTG